MTHNQLNPEHYDVTLINEILAKYNQHGYLKPYTAKDLVDWNLTGEESDEELEEMVKYDVDAQIDGLNEYSSRQAQEDREEEDCYNREVNGW